MRTDGSDNSYLKYIGRRERNNQVIKETKRKQEKKYKSVSSIYLEEFHFVVYIVKILLLPR